jgi:hypothetical protein
MSNRSGSKETGVGSSKALIGTRGCFHPVRLGGEVVDLATGELTRSTLTVACANRRAIICPPCADLYRGDAWVVTAVGLGGGKGVDPSVALQPRIFVTLTAPSFGPVHRASTGQCRPWGNHGCHHGRSLLCREVHDETDDLVGTPMCERCFDYRGAVLWNEAVARLWTRTLQEARREAGKIAGVRRPELERSVRLSFLKAAEFQRRGLVHVHGIVRADGVGDGTPPPPEWLSSSVLVKAFGRSALRSTVPDALGFPVKWGSQRQIAVIATDDEIPQKVAAYLSKYATKTTDGGLAFAYRFRDRRQIEATRAPSHLVRLALTAFDLGTEPELEGLDFGRAANSFGFRGQLVTKSQRYSTTFTALRRARAAYHCSANTHAPISGSFHYRGRGYDDPTMLAGAEILHRMKSELRAERRQARLLEHPVNATRDEREVVSP